MSPYEIVWNQFNLGRLPNYRKNTVKKAIFSAYKLGEDHIFSDIFDKVWNKEKGYPWEVLASFDSILNLGE